jgi:hypothetical protein
MTGGLASAVSEAGIVIGVVGWAGEQVYDYFSNTVIPFLSNSVPVSQSGTLRFPYYH